MLREFVEIAEKREEPFSSICARFGVSRTTGYKWLKRYRERGVAGLVEQSRRPKSSPRKIPESVEDLVHSLRRENPDWSGVRIAEELKAKEISPLPAPSTIDLILRRRRLGNQARQVATWGAKADVMRFEPNYRWAIQYGRIIRLANGEETCPVLVRDVATKFIIGGTLLKKSERDTAMIPWLESLFKRFGMPWRMRIPVARNYTDLEVWLIRLGQGVDFAPEVSSDENSELRHLASSLAKLPSYQRGPLEERAFKKDTFDALYRTPGLVRDRAQALIEGIREKENFGGKQEALQKRSPIALYRPSIRDFPSLLPEISYESQAEVRLVSEKGMFTFQRRLVHVGRNFAGLLVELRPLPEMDHYLVLLSMQVLGEVDLSNAKRDETTSLPLRH